MRLACAIVLVVGLALPAKAQDERGWSFSGSFSGSSNTDGIVMKTDPTLGYTFSSHFQTYAGVPFYFVNKSSTAPTTGTASTGSGFVKGIGNAFLGGRLDVGGDALSYSSTLELTAPTGDKARGFTTGRATADWTNRFSHKMDSFTPFGSAGLANTVSDTKFFVRPFTSLGMVVHFEGGGTYDFSRYVYVSGSAYGVRGMGQQTIISRLLKRGTTGGTSTGTRKRQVFETQAQTVTTSDAANDHGMSGWFGVSPSPGVDLHIGYTRSIAYDFNTFFFGVGFRVGK